MSTDRRSPLMAATFACVLITFTAFGATSDFDFDDRLLQRVGLEATRVGEQPQTLRESAPRRNGRKDILARNIVSTTGGVILVEVAEPKSDLASSCPSVRYDESNPDGGRLVFRYGDMAASMDLPDWSIKPLVEFVNSKDDVAVTYMKYELEYHPAFDDNLEGANFAFADFAGRDNFTKFHQLLHPLAPPGYGTPSSLATAGSDRANQIIGNWLNSDSVSWTQYMVTDAGIRTEFNIDPVRNRLEISGALKLVKVAARRDASGEITGGTITDTFDDLSILRDANPVIISAALRSARSIAYFRYLRDQCHETWSSLNLIVEYSEIDHVRIRTMPKSRT